MNKRKEAIEIVLGKCPKCNERRQQGNLFLFTFCQENEERTVFTIEHNKCGYSRFFHWYDLEDACVEVDDNISMWHLPPEVHKRTLAYQRNIAELEADPLTRPFVNH